MWTKWAIVILASIVSVALGVTLREDKRVHKTQDLRAAQCCNDDKLLKSFFKHVPLQCAFGINCLRIRQSDKEICKPIKCYLKHKNLFNRDKSINEVKMKKLFVKNADRDLKELMPAALDKCFINYKTFAYSVRKGCKSGADSLFRCITAELIPNCPKRMWHFWTKPECRC